MTKQKLILKSLLGATALTVFSAGSAFAQTTPTEAAAFTGAGQGIQNTFTLSYEVDGEAQDDITNDSDGNRTTFTVDRMVDLTVVSSGDNTVAPGATDEDLIFTVTNLGNDTQAYKLTATDGVDGTDDDFDPIGTDIFFILPGSSTEVQYNGTNYPELEPGEELTVIVRRDIDSGQIDGEEADITLLAETLHAADMEVTDPVTGTTSTVPNPDVGTEVTGDATNDLDVVENVLVDGAGDDDANTDGDFSDTGTYIVGSPNLTAEKIVRIFTEDGSGCNVFPGTPGAGNKFAIPGACVEYRIRALNSGSVSATSLNIQDILPDNLEFVAVNATGFAGGSFTTEPLGGTLCDGTATTCDIVFAGGAALAPPVSPATENLGVIIIRALIQ